MSGNVTGGGLRTPSGVDYWYHGRRIGCWSHVRARENFGQGNDAGGVERLVVIRATLGLQ